jgi:uncharacterized protein
MKQTWNLFLLLFPLVFLNCQLNQAQEENREFPPLHDLSKIEILKDAKEKGFPVNDFDGVLTISEKEQLSNLILSYADKTTRQIVVVTVEDYEPYEDIQRFGSDLGNYWGVGNSEKNNGLLIVLCVPCRKIGISTGYGTQEVLTDDICKFVIDSVMPPKFREEKYFLGLKSGTLELIKRWN